MNKWEFVKVGKLWHALSRIDGNQTVCGIRVYWFYTERLGFHKVDGVCISANIPDIACIQCGSYTEKYVNENRK